MGIYINCKNFIMFPELYVLNTEIDNNQAVKLILRR